MNRIPTYRGASLTDLNKVLESNTEKKPDGRLSTIFEKATSGANLSSDNSSPVATKAISRVKTNKNRAPNLGLDPKDERELLDKGLGDANRKRKIQLGLPAMSDYSHLPPNTRIEVRKSTYYDVSWRNN